MASTEIQPPPDLLQMRVPARVISVNRIQSGQPKSVFTKPTIHAGLRWAVFRLTAYLAPRKNRECGNALFCCDAEIGVGFLNGLSKWLSKP